MTAASVPSDAAAGAAGTDMRTAPLIKTAIRELKEETSIVFGETDTARVINPLLFSTPGMTDESNALVLLSINRDSMPDLSTSGAVGSECFDGFSLLTKEDALRILRQGTDDNGIFIPYTPGLPSCILSQCLSDADNRLIPCSGT